MRSRVLVALASSAFVASVYWANWLVNHYGPVRVWPTALLAPAGVYVVGAAFLLRDTVQRLAGPAWLPQAPLRTQVRCGQLLALLLVAAGAALSALVSVHLAEASAAAFAASEAAGLLAFWLCGGTTGGPVRVGVAVAVASLLAAAIDSWLFLHMAFGSEEFFRGQFVAKVSVVLLALPAVLLARRRWPAPAPAPV